MRNSNKHTYPFFFCDLRVIDSLLNLGDFHYGTNFVTIPAVPSNALLNLLDEI